MPSGKRDPESRAATGLLREAGDHVEMLHDVGAPDLDLATGRLGNPRRLAEVGDDVANPDRLGPRPQPLRLRQRRQPPRDRAQELVRLALGADDHRRPEVGERRPGLAKDLRGPVAAREVGRAALIGTEAAEVDDPLDARGPRGGSEPGCRHLLADGVVAAAAQHVHEEVGDVHALHRRLEVVLAVEVTRDDLDRRSEDPAGRLGIAGQRPDPDAVGEQCGHQPAADHAGGARDEVGGSRRLVAGGLMRGSCRRPTLRSRPASTIGPPPGSRAAAGTAGTRCRPRRGSGAGSARRRRRRAGRSGRGRGGRGRSSRPRPGRSAEPGRGPRRPRRATPSRSQRSTETRSAPLPRPSTATSRPRSIGHSTLP